MRYLPAEEWQTDDSSISVPTREGLECMVLTEFVIAVG
jgi:hypothetical protein